MWGSIFIRFFWQPVTTYIFHSKCIFWSISAFLFEWMNELKKGLGLWKGLFVKLDPSKSLWPQKCLFWPLTNLIIINKKEGLLCVSENLENLENLECVMCKCVPSSRTQGSVSNWKWKMRLYVNEREGPTIPMTAGNNFWGPTTL